MFFFYHAISASSWTPSARRRRPIRIPSSGVPWERSSSCEQPAPRRWWTLSRESHRQAKNPAIAVKRNRRRVARTDIALEFYNRSSRSDHIGTSARMLGGREELGARRGRLLVTAQGRRRGAPVHTPRPSPLGEHRAGCTQPSPVASLAGLRLVVTQPFWRMRSSSLQLYLELARGSKRWLRANRSPVSEAAAKARSPLRAKPAPGARPKAPVVTGPVLLALVVVRGRPWLLGVVGDHGAKPTGWGWVGLGRR
jgi:hypothetical protein